jgi:hypothetical protein
MLRSARFDGEGESVTPIIGVGWRRVPAGVLYLVGIAGLLLTVATGWYIYDQHVQVDAYNRALQSAQVCSHKGQSSCISMTGATVLSVQTQYRQLTSARYGNDQYRVDTVVIRLANGQRQHIALTNNESTVLDQVFRPEMHATAWYWNGTIVALGGPKGVDETMESPSNQETSSMTSTIYLLFASLIPLGLGWWIRKSPSGERTKKSEWEAEYPTIGSTIG